MDGIDREGAPSLIGADSEDALASEALGTRNRIGGAKKARFFLHEGIASRNVAQAAQPDLLPALEEDLVDCFFETLGGAAGFDDLDDRLNPRAAQSMVDYWLLRQRKGERREHSLHCSSPCPKGIQLRSNPS